MQNLLLQLFQIKEQKIKLIKLDKDEIQKSIANKSYYYVFGYSKASNTWSVNYRALYNLLPYYKGGNIWRVVESFRHIFAFATHITELTNILIWYAAPNSEFKKK